MLLRVMAMVLAMGFGGLLAQAPKEAAKPHVPELLAGEGFAISGTDGEVQAYGEAKAERSMGSLAGLAWLAFEGTEWAARDVAFRCTPGVVTGLGPDDARGSTRGDAERAPRAGGPPSFISGADAPACGGPKGHGRVDLEKATREGCSRAFLAWIAGSIPEWKRVYGEGVGRSRVEEAFEPFLGKRLGRGDQFPAFDAAWIGEGELLRTSPAAFLGWLNDPQRVDLVSRCRRTLGSRVFHLKDFIDTEDWWYFGGSPNAKGGAWIVGGNGRIITVLHAPSAATGAHGVARLKTILGLRKK